MSKLAHDGAADAYLAYFSSNITDELICSGDPADRAAALTAALADKGSAPTFTGPADAGGGGRQLTIDQAATMLIDTSGTAATVCWISATLLLLKTNVNPTQALVANASNTVTRPAVVVTVGDPA